MHWTAESGVPLDTLRRRPRAGTRFTFAPRGTARAKRPVYRSRTRSDYSIADSFGCALIAEDAASYGGDIGRRARELDRQLVGLARSDSAGRRVLGRLADRFIGLRGHERLGFANLGDYSAERLGWSGRQIQEVARVARSMMHLPAIESAFLGGKLGWAKARLLASLATPSDEQRWLAIGMEVDVRQLAAITSSARSAAKEERPIGGCDPGNVNAGRGSPPVDDQTDDDDEEESRVMLRIECTRRARLMWSDARRYAARMAGRALAPWQVAELVAGEAGSVPAPFADVWREEPWRSLAAVPSSNAAPPMPAAIGRQRKARPGNDRAARGDGVSPACNDDVCDDRIVDASHTTDDAKIRTACCDATGSNSVFDHEIERLEELNAFQLDESMRRVRTAMQKSDAELGLALGLVVELRLYEQLGYRSAADYARERLGIAERTARDLTRVATVARTKSPLLAEAYAHGKLSSLQVQTLLAVVRPWNSAAWIARATEVTLRRLADEVAWALRRADLAPQFSAMMPPAPGQDPGQDARHDLGRGLDEDKGGDDDRRMCARDTEAGSNSGGGSDPSSSRAADPGRDQLWGILGRLHVTFASPLSVSVMFREVMQGFASPLEPRSTAFERMLEHVLTQWTGQPRHRDPVFQRDGYRCTAPGCSAFANLHDHHIVPRSAGGSNALSNRTTLCAWHHLRGVHGGLARASGEAPEDITWELGLRESQPSLMRLRGERYEQAGGGHPA